MHTEGYLAGLYYTLFVPDGQPVQATVLLLHGMAEHHKRYTDFADYLVSHGIAVLAYDQRGHGRTAQNPAELGFFQRTNPVERLIADAAAMAAHVARCYPEAPHFLLGHSMGSFVARCLLQRAGGSFRGAVLVGTAAGTPGTTLGRALLGALNKLAPRHRTSVVNGLFGWLNNRHFK